MIKTEVTGNLFPFHPDFIEMLGAKSVASASHRFAAYLKNRRFAELFESQTGETKGSIGTYRFSGKKQPTYVVKAGVGIPGNLNYLAGLYRGRAVSRSGKVFSFARKRDLISDGWKAWGGDGQLAAASEQQLNKMIAEIK